MNAEPAGPAAGRDERSAIPGVRDLDHVGLNVPDLDQAVEFFTRRLGADVVFRLERFADPDGGSLTRLGAPATASLELAMLALGAGRLELLHWEDGSPTTAPPGAADTGGSHVAVEVADVGSALADLRAVPGVRVLGEPVTFTAGPTPGLTNAFATTPWGALLELVSWG
jgi:catechol 2,3-dioxygenase-like lactoylglutathione lyase family enzyme